MSLILSVTTSDPIVTKALTDSWEAGLVAFLGLGASVLIFWLVKSLYKANQKRQEDERKENIAREGRLVGRVTSLEQFVQSDLLTAHERAVSALEKTADAQRATSLCVQTSTEALGKLCLVVDRVALNMDERPCQWSHQRQAEMFEEILKRLGGKGSGPTTV